jgi:hypothetical protein
MKIPKEQILEFVADWSSLAALAEAHRELPDIVDTERDASLLAMLGVDPDVVIGQFNGMTSNTNNRSSKGVTDKTHHAEGM